MLFHIWFLWQRETPGVVGQPIKQDRDPWTQAREYKSGGLLVWLAKLSSLPQEGGPHRLRTQFQRPDLRLSGSVSLSSQASLSHV